jgi:hypothetical protein
VSLIKSFLDIFSLFDQIHALAKNRQFYALYTQLQFATFFYLNSASLLLLCDNESKKIKINKSHKRALAIDKYAIGDNLSTT